MKCSAQKHREDKSWLLLLAICTRSAAATNSCSADAVGTIAGSGYFNDVTTQLNQDDVIIAVGATGGTRTVDVLVVTSATAAATVTTTNGT